MGRPRAKNHKSRRDNIEETRLSGVNREIRLAGKQGFEPRFHDPESCVLPLDDFPAGLRMILDLTAFFNTRGFKLGLMNHLL